MSQAPEVVLARVRPTRLLSAHYYTLILLLLVATTASLLGYFPSNMLSPGLRFFFGVGLGVFAIFLYLVSEWRRLSHKYTVYDQRVGVAEGLLRKRVQYMPYNKVERIEINQSFIGRIFGIGNLVVDTGDDVMTLRSIRSPSKVEQMVSRQIASANQTFQRPSGIVPSRYSPTGN